MEIVAMVLIISLVIMLVHTKSELNRERNNADRWRETAIMLNRQITKGEQSHGR